MRQKKYIGALLLLFITTSTFAQKAERDYIRKGNRAYKDSIYVDAEVNYRKALEAKSAGYAPLFDSLKGETALMLSNTGNAPAKLIKEFVGKDKESKPYLKAAYVEETVFIGANQLEVLSQLKSKNELIADLVALLQSPAKNVVSALQSGGNTIHGVLKTLGER